MHEKTSASEFEFEHLAARTVANTADGHCGGCDGCSGCSHLV
jgi:hypothetical protein